MIDTGLRDRVVLITGGNHGIGAATARAFAAQGAKVFITYLRLSSEDYGIDREEARLAGAPGLPLYHAAQMKSADEVMGQIRDAGGRVESWETDLTNATIIPELFDRAEGMLGPVSVLVNNAAYCERPPDAILTTSAVSIDKHFAVNTRAVVLLISELVRRHKDRSGRWGRVINVSTDAAKLCRPDLLRRQQGSHRSFYPKRGDRGRTAGDHRQYRGSWTSADRVHYPGVRGRVAARDPATTYRGAEGHR